jgi:hypothetical protein
VWKTFILQDNVDQLYRRVAMNVLSQNHEKWDSGRAETVKRWSSKETRMMVGLLKAHKMRNLNEM